MSEEAASDNIEPELPQWLIDQIDESIANGVFLRMAGHRTPEEWRKTSAIIWRPGRPNELARIIIEYCKEPITLELDGHKFRIEPAHENITL